MEKNILFNGKMLPTIFSVFNENEVKVSQTSDGRYFVQSIQTNEIVFVFRTGKGRLPYMSFRQIGVTDSTVAVDDCAIQLNEDVSVYSEREIALIKSFITYALVN